MGVEAVGAEAEAKSPDKLSVRNMVSPYFLSEREVSSRKENLYDVLIKCGYGIEEE